VFGKNSNTWGTVDQATKLQALSYSNMIDDILYANSLVNGLKPFAVDSDLRNFIRLK
jgi:hypothetical protein